MTREEEVAMEKEIKKESMISGNGYPSIELFLHAYFYRIVAHTHPLVVNAITCQLDWKDKLFTLYPDALFISYETPGIRLAVEMKKALEKYYIDHPEDPHIIFMQNHGLVVSYDSIEAVKQTQKNITQKLEEIFELDFTIEHNSSSIQEILRLKAEGELYSVFPSKNEKLKKILHENPNIKSLPQFCPDGLIYCGESFLQCRSIQDFSEKITTFLNKYHQLKVLFLGEEIYYIASSIRKAKEVEEVFEFFVNAVYLAGDAKNICPLPIEERDFLLNWEAEKYRQSK